VTHDLPADLARLLDAVDPTEQGVAWASFVRDRSDTILRVAHSLGGGYDAAMNRYAFVLEQLQTDGHRRLRNYQGPGDFGLWLSVVTRRLCVDYYRRQYGRTRLRRDEESSRATFKARRRLVDLVVVALEESPVEGEASDQPDEVLIRAERSREIARALNDLAPRDRLLLRFRFVEDLPAREIAGLMGFPTLFHVYRRLDGVLKDLRATLERAGVEGLE
jgi:RNA polymerase sigma factor (sigma-70 family)